MDENSSWGGDGAHESLTVKKNTKKKKTKPQKKKQKKKKKKSKKKKSHSPIIAMQYQSIQRSWDSLYFFAKGKKGKNIQHMSRGDFGGWG